MNFWRYNIHAKKDPLDRFFRDNVHIWRTDNRKIVGLCISEYGGNDMFLEVLPEYQHMYPDMFRWIDTVWAVNRTAVELDVFYDDAYKIQMLETQGFSFICHFENKRTYELDQVEFDYTLEEGFSIHAFSELSDFAGRVALVQRAFDNPSYTEDNLKGLMASPDYIDEYNLLVVSPDGQQVAYCVGWYNNSKNHCGYIEPVGTHAAFRQRGFAKAINRARISRSYEDG